MTAQVDESGYGSLVRRPSDSQCGFAAGRGGGKLQIRTGLLDGSNVHLLPAQREKRATETGNEEEMALSQCLEDSPLRVSSKHSGVVDTGLQVYDERHRLALEELLSAGVDSFLDFLRRENIPNFLSDDEIQRILAAAVAVPPRCASVHGDDQLEQSLASSMDCSSVTYFPEVSDVEPPVLEIGWPAFTAGSYRGVTRATAYFQPSGEIGASIYSCKEAARRLINTAREVIAIVSDSLTDLDIFKALQEACTVRKVPVYILLDQSSAPAFLKMCRNLGVFLDDLRQMRVRTITGPTYYMRSGTRITGRVHERFMLIDGNRVATGSYRFNWTDGRLNSSNLIELSGQITEKFDEEFRILYAQSLPVNPRGTQSIRNSGIYEHLLNKNPLVSSPCLAPLVRERLVEPPYLTSTPGRKWQASCQPSPKEAGRKSSLASNKSTVGEDWSEQNQMLAENIDTSDPLPAHQEESVSPDALSCHAGTQTSWSVADSDTQTDSQLSEVADPSPSVTANTQSQTQTITLPAAPQSPPALADSDGAVKDCFHRLTKERQHHYSAIRSKLEHMMATLSQRRDLTDISNMTQRPSTPSRLRADKDCGHGPNPRLLGENAGVGTRPRARCVH